MTNQELFKTMKKYVKQEEHFSININDILHTYKNAGGKRKAVEKYINKLATAYEDIEVLHQRTNIIRNAMIDWKTKKINY